MIKSKFGMHGENLDERINDLVRMFYSEYKSLRQIGKEIGCSPVAVKNTLNKFGHDCSKEATHFKIMCEFCGIGFTRVRCQIRFADKRNYKKFCSNKCYKAKLDEGAISHYSITTRPENAAYGIRQAMRLSRKLVKKYFGLLPVKSIVHHIDGNDWNIDIRNLMLLDSQKSHNIIHGRCEGIPVILFDGSKLTDTDIILYDENLSCSGIDEILASEIPQIPENNITAI
jgi:hypothetical protein